MKMIEKGFINDKLNLNLDIYVQNGREWFKAQDIAEFFGYDATAQMTRNLNKPELHSYMQTLHTAQGNAYQAMFIDEYALYELTLKITKANPERYEKAQIFQDWVFGEVLPSLRKNGAYIMIEEGDTIELLQSKAQLALDEATQKLIDMEDKLRYEEEANKVDAKEMENLIARNDYLEDRNEYLTDENYRLKKIAKYFLDKDKEQFVKQNGLIVPMDSSKFKKFLSDITTRLVNSSPIYTSVRIPDYYEREEDFYA